MKKIARRWEKLSMSASRHALSLYKINRTSQLLYTLNSVKRYISRWSHSASKIRVALKLKTASDLSKEA